MARIIRPKIVDNLSSASTDASLSAKQGKVLNDRISALPTPPAPVQVVDNLTSTSSSAALSAKQGKVLNDHINALPKAPQVIDNLTSTSNTAALSAKQGKVLNDRINALPAPTPKITVTSGSGIRVSLSGNVYKISYDGTVTKKYNDIEINNMFSSWSKKTRNIGGIMNCSAACYSEDHQMFLVACSGSNTGFVSVDSGDTFQQVQFTSSDNFTDAIYVPYHHKFYIIASGSNKIQLSHYGTADWSESTFRQNLDYSQICWAQELRCFFAVASTTSNDKIMCSDIINNWTEKNIIGGDIGLAGICYSKEHHKLIAVSSNNLTSIVSSRDGLTWTTSSPLPIQQYWNKILYSPAAKTFLIVGTNSSKACISTNGGVSWTQVNLPRPMTMKAMMYIDALEMFVGAEYNTNKLIASSDGKIWKEYNLPMLSGYSCMAYDSYRDRILLMSDNSKDYLVSAALS